jgi:hypothetical protein
MKKLVLIVLVSFASTFAYAGSSSWKDVALDACQSLKGYCSGDIINCSQVVSKAVYFEPSAVAVCKSMIGNLSCGVSACLESIKNKTYTQRESNLCGAYVGTNTGSVAGCMANLGTPVSSERETCLSNGAIINDLDSALNALYRRESRAAIRRLEDLRADLKSCR